MEQTLYSLTICAPFNVFLDIVEAILLGGGLLIENLNDVYGSL